MLRPDAVRAQSSRLNTKPHAGVRANASIEVKLPFVAQRPYYSFSARFQRFQNRALSGLTEQPQLSLANDDREETA
jgi:hypothetical protein